MHALRQLMLRPKPPGDIPPGFDVPTSSLCANCGQVGHYYKHCRFPICSFGVICFRLVADMATNALVPQYLMVQRKDSLQYVEFVRGKYQASDRGYIQSMLNEMTPDEQTRLRMCSFMQLWRSVWGASEPRKCLAVEFEASCKVYAELRDGVHGYTLLDLTTSITKSIQERQWGFPKGRRNIRESDDMCALREFTEETGVNCMAIHQFGFVFEEQFVGSNGVTYKHKYFLARLVDGRAAPCDRINRTQAREIADTKWMTFDQAMDKIVGEPSRVRVLEMANLETMKIMTCGAEVHPATRMHRAPDLQRAPPDRTQDLERAPPDRAQDLERAPPDRAPELQRAPPT
jgi:8-oxo-dGTP pyrophosphatase MutT (NUDIX family)